MADKDDVEQTFEWGIEAENIELTDIGVLPPNMFCVKTNQVFGSPRVSIRAAKIKLVKLPKNYKPSLETCYAEILKWPKAGKLPRGTAIVKIADRPGLPGTPLGTVFIDTVEMPSVVRNGGIKEMGIRFPIIPPTIIGKK